MTIDFTLEEVQALADVAELAADRDGAPMPLVTAWLKLVRAQAERLAGPPAAQSIHSRPAVGPVDSVPAPMPGVTRMGAGTLSSDTWGLR